MMTTAPSQSNPGTLSTLLLLDAENLDMTRGLEHFLATEISPYPVRYRYAFGNWRGLGERDRLLHSRGYRLIQVPSGKNSADMHMALDGIALIHRQPDIRAVFICSNDQDFSHLSNTLIHLGMLPFRVYRKGADCQIDNLLDRTTCYFAVDEADQIQARALSELSFKPGSLPFTPSALRFSPYLIRMRLQKLLEEVAQQYSNQGIQIGELGTLYHRRYEQSLREVLRGCHLGESLKDFLAACPEVFVLMDPRNKHAQPYVRLRHASPAASEPCQEEGGAEPVGRVTLPEEAEPRAAEFWVASAPSKLEKSAARAIAAEAAEATRAAEAAKAAKAAKAATNTAPPEASPSPAIPLAIAAPLPQQAELPLEVEFIPPRPTINDIRSLENALVQILWQLSPHQDIPGHVSLSKLSASFQKAYQESLSQTLKRIGHPKSITKFLGKCSTLRLHQGQDRLWVGLARVA